MIIITIVVYNNIVIIIIIIMIINIIIVIIILFISSILSFFALNNSLFCFPLLNCVGLKGSYESQTWKGRSWWEGGGDWGGNWAWRMEMIYWEGERGNKRKLEWERGDFMNEIMKNKKGRKARVGGRSSPTTFGTFL